jgi:DNA-binding GntR family transcriptional regulator
MAPNIESQYRTMQEIVYETLRDEILKGKFTPGQRLITSDLANEMGVSRMPVREALQRLDASTGLVTLIPRKGAIVNDFSSPKDLEEIYNLRAILEGYAVRLACQNMTEKQIDELEKINQRIVAVEGTENEDNFQDLNMEFHKAIWNATDSPRLVRILKTLHDASRGYRYISLKIPGRLDTVANEHKEIIAILRKKDAIAVEKSMKSHYENTLKWILRSYREKSEEKQ